VNIRHDAEMFLMCSNMNQILLGAPEKTWKKLITW